MGLILSRKIGQSIIIRDDIIVTVTEVSNSYGNNPQIKLMITAPENVPVHRMEIYQRILNEKITSSNKD